MRVLCVNCQNNAINQRGGVSTSGYDYCQMLANHIIDGDYDIVGTQEMSMNFTNRIQNYLTDYKLYGKYRSNFKILGLIFPKIKNYSENNKIMVKEEVLSERTIYLPFIPNKIKEIYKGLKKGSLMRRIASGALVNSKELGKIYILNTHLDYYIGSVQKKQLNKIYKHLYIKSKSYPIILTGDFNLEIGNPIFDEFISKLEKLGIKRVPINDKTNALKYRNKTAIDHIFISDIFKINSYGVINDDNLKEVTDHHPIYVDFEKEDNYDTIIS